jgi:hypothetical protein
VKERGDKLSVRPPKATCARCRGTFDFLIEDLSDFIRNRLDQNYRDEYLQYAFLHSKDRKRHRPRLTPHAIQMRRFRTLRHYIAAHDPYCREVDMGYPSDRWPPTLGGSRVPRGFQVIETRVVYQDRKGGLRIFDPNKA